MPALDRLIWLLAAIIFAGCLAACSTLNSTFDIGDRVWYKPGGTIEERDRLLAAAQVQAVKAHADETPGAPDQKNARQQTERHTVLTFMTAAGWRLVPKTEAGPLDHARKTNSAPRSLVAPTGLDR